MPITSIDVRDGDPTIQASGEHRGTVTATFADGRTVEKSIRAADANAWMDKLAAISSEIQAQVELSDAEQAVDPEGEVTGNGEASIAQAAVAYLRAAWDTDQAADAYLLFARFNTYRNNQGWTLDQVAAGLAAAGLEADEWDAMKTAYQYLNGGGRPAIMATAKTVQGNWEAR